VYAQQISFLDFSEPDSLEYQKALVEIRIQKANDFSRNRNYSVIQDFTKDESRFQLNFSIQEYLENTNIQSTSFGNKMQMLENSNEPWIQFVPAEGKKEIIYGIWRQNLIHISNENQLPERIGEGFDFLVSEGYSDLAVDYLPFIGMLMEEQYLYHYDKTRLAAFGKGAKGIVTTVDLLNSLATQDPAIVAGVCRDTHDAGLRILRVLAQDYYTHFYPEKNIDIDDYIFLQSWTTDHSQHITISLINPTDMSKVYELDWGRTIVKDRTRGYEHGRNYGNTYRIWKFDKHSNTTIPLDFKRTQIGKLYDRHFFSFDENTRFMGIPDFDTYSDITYFQPAKHRISYTASVGILPMQQYFGLLGLIHRSRLRHIGRFIEYRGATGLQVLYFEDHLKKNLLFPIYHYSKTYSLQAMPRYIAAFKTKDMRLSNKLKLDLFSENTIEIFLTSSYFDSDNPTDYKHYNKSGDGNVIFVQGARMQYGKDKDKFSARMILQNRSFPIPKDVRLMSPNPFELFGNAIIVSPAKDLILDFNYNAFSQFSLAWETIGEYTNMHAVLLFSQIVVKKQYKNQATLSASASITRQLKGLSYYWYPTENISIKAEFETKNQANSIGILLQFPKNQPPVFGISYKKLINNG